MFIVKANAKEILGESVCLVIPKPREDPQIVICNRFGADGMSPELRAPMSFCRLRRTESRGKKLQQLRNITNFDTAKT